MIRRWLCTNGHDGDGSVLACPACGLPVSIQTVKASAVVEETMTGDVRDLVFMEAFPPFAPSRMRPPEAPNGYHPSPSAGDSPDETLQKPSNGPATRPSEPPTVAAPPSAVVAPPPDAPDMTLQKPATIPPDGRPTNLKVWGPPTEPAPQNHGETLVRPTVPSSAKQPTSVPQATVTGYEILGILGRGGMGVVYKARQVGLNRIVALKMILSGAHASDEELQRFRTEAEAVARLRHPNIVQIFDIGERDGRPHFALEYCEGGSLQQQLDGTPMDPRRAATLLATLAEAVAHAHAHGIIHRDLKPANILLTADGEPKLTDFGLAKRIDEDQGQTGTEAVLGTPTYMAPEQAAGKTRQVGPSADLYSLGAIFYDLLTGRPPFRGTTVLDTIQMVQTAEPVPPRRLQPGVPADLQTICLKCLEKDPHRRYPGAKALAEDLRAYLDGRPIQARPTTALERGWKWARRKPALAGLVALAVLTPLVVAGVSLGFSLHLAGLNTQISEQNDALGEKTTALEDSNTTLEAQKVQLEARKVELENSQTKLQTALQDLQERQNKLEKALSGEQSAKEDAQTSFLEAQVASDDLLNLARVELRKPGSEKMRQTILRRAVSMCKRFTARPGDYPVARLRAARAHRLTGDLEVALNETPAAIANYDTSMGLYDGLIREGDKAAVSGVDYRAESLELSVQLWAALVRTNDARAPALLRDTLARVEALDDATRARPEYRRPHAILVGNRGLLHQLGGDLVAARRDYDRAIAWLGTLADRPDSALERARLLVHRASLTTQTGGDPKAARRDCAEAIASLGKMAKPSDDPMIAAELGRAHNVDAGLAAQAGDMEAARQSYQDAVNLFLKLHELAPLVPDYAHLLAVAQRELGRHLLRMKRTNPARKELDASLTALRTLAERYPDVPAYRFDLGRVRHEVGVVLVSARDLTRAVASFEAAETKFAALAEAEPNRPDIRLALLGVYRNLIYCRDRQARQAIERSESRAAAEYVAQLVALRKKYEQALPKATEGTPWREQARLWGERLMMRYEQIRTLRTLANVLEADGSHQGMAQAMADLRALVDASWSGNLRSAATYSRALGLARTARPELAGDYGKKALALLGPLAASGMPGLGERLDGADFAALRKAYPEEVRRLKERWQGAMK